MATPGQPVRPPWMLLILMTLASFGGPVGIWAVLRGGARSGWPPDRPVEWMTLLGTCGLVLALMGLAVAKAIVNQREAERIRSARRDPGRAE